MFSFRQLIKFFKIFYRVNLLETEKNVIEVAIAVPII
jgi:hypothetical protein